MRSALLVEDSAIIAFRLKRILQEEGFAPIEHATDSSNASVLIARHVFDLAIVDAMLDDGATGILVARALRVAQPNCRIILCSSDCYAITAQSMQAVYVQKGVDFPERIRAVIRAAKKERL